MVSIDQAITEDEVIGTFLLGEIDGRFRAHLLACCARHGLTEGNLRDPHPADEQVRERRRRVLAEHRGWPDRDLCAGLPADLRWHRATLDLDDLRARVFTIQYWFEERWGTRSPAAIAAQLSAAGDQGGWPSGPAILAALRAGARPADPILVTRPSLDRMVVLEGNTRIVTYVTDPRHVPLPLRAIVGISAIIDRWSEW